MFRTFEFIKNVVIIDYPNAVCDYEYSMTEGWLTFTIIKPDGNKQSFEIDKDTSFHLLDSLFVYLDVCITHMNKDKDKGFDDILHFVDVFCTSDSLSIIQEYRLDRTVRGLRLVVLTSDKKEYSLYKEDKFMYNSFYDMLSRKKPIRRDLDKIETDLERIIA